MKTYSLASMSLIISVVFMVTLMPTQAADEPDLILFNGKVITVDAQDHVYQAIAIKDGKVFRVGADQEIKALAGPLSIMINLKGKTVTP